MYLLAASKDGERWLVQHSRGPAVFENVVEVHNYIAEHTRHDDFKYEIITVQATHSPVLTEVVSNE